MLPNHMLSNKSHFCTSFYDGLLSLIYFKTYLNKFMKKLLFAALLTLPFCSQGQEKMPFQKNGDKNTFLPVLKKGYHPQVGVALISGWESFSSEDIGSDAKTSPVYGLEISLQCPLLCTKKNYIRQQITLVSQDHEGIKTFAAELNPHYRFIVHPKFDIGAGPSLGFIFANINNAHKTVFSYGLGASGAYYFNHFFLGADVRYALTGEAKFENKDDNSVAEVDLSNIRYGLKLGYRF